MHLNGHKRRHWLGRDTVFGNPDELADNGVSPLDTRKVMQYLTHSRYTAPDTMTQNQYDHHKKHALCTAIHIDASKRSLRKGNVTASQQKVSCRSGSLETYRDDDDTYIGCRVQCKRHTSSSFKDLSHPSAMIP